MVLLAGCASRPLEEPSIKSVPGALIADSGASLYVLEAWDDWLDECDRFIIRGPADVGFTDIDEKADLPPSSKVNWMGEQALKLVLRHGLSQKKVSLLAHADIQPYAGLPMEVTLYKPEPEERPGGDSKREAFRVRQKATPKDRDYVDISFEAELLTERPASDDPGGRTAKRIDGGSTTLTFGGTIFMRHPKAGHRVYILLLRIASLKDP